MSTRILTLFSAVNFLGLLAVIGLQFSHREKAVYLDSAKLLNNYQSMVEARKAYQGKVSVWKANVDTLAREMQAEVSKFEKEGPSMTTKEKQLARQLLQSKQQQLLDYQKALQEKAGQEDAAATKKVIDEVNAYVKAYGQQHGYTIIFAATAYGNIAYGKDALDVTEEVLEGLNQTYTRKVAN